MTVAERHPVFDEILGDLVWGHVGELIDHSPFWLNFFNEIWKSHPELRDELEAQISLTRTTQE